MKIAIGSDHLALELKNIIRDFLKEKEIRARKQFSKAGKKFDFSIFKNVG